VHPVYRVHRPRGGGGSPVHRGLGGGTGSTPHWSGARIRLWARLLIVRAPRGKGAEGNLTVVGGGRHGNGARPAMSFNNGGYLLSTTRGSGWEETKVGAVESGRGVGAFYRSGTVGGGRSRNNRLRLGGASMGWRFQALIRHQGEGKRRGGTRRGSVGDAVAPGGGVEAVLSTTAVSRMGAAVAVDRRS
jgi:hypothetical protein